MYLTELIEPLATEQLRKLCVGKKVTFTDYDLQEKVTIQCKDVKFITDDGDGWIKFIEEDGNECFPDGQGLDIWFEVLD